MPLAGRRRDREARPERERDWSGTRLTRVTDSDVTDCCVLVKVPRRALCDSPRSILLWVSGDKALISAIAYTMIDAIVLINKAPYNPTPRPLRLQK